MTNKEVNNFPAYEIDLNKPPIDDEGLDWNKPRGNADNLKAKIVPPPMHPALCLLDEGDITHNLVKEKFNLLSRLLGVQADVVAIYRNIFSSVIGQAKKQSFQIHLKAMAKKCNGNANLKHAWFGASKQDAYQILEHGFDLRACDWKPYGVGIYLSAEFSPDQCLKDTRADENGLKYLLLCRVILGNLEVVEPGSRQYGPKSLAYDCGVDDMFSPKNYIVWSTHMNTRILPEYVISFNASFFEGFVKSPKLSSMPFPVLFDELSKIVSPTCQELIAENHKQYIEHKLSRYQLVKRLKYLVGEELWTSVVKSCQDKTDKPSTS